MAEAVETVIYKMGLQGAEQFAVAGRILDVFERSSDKVTIAVEKLGKANRISQESWNKIVGSLDPAVKATLRMGTAVKQLSDYQQEGRGTAAEYSAFSEKMINNLLKGVGVTERLGVNFKELTENFNPATSSVKRLDDVFHQLSDGVKFYIKDAGLAQLATEELAKAFNKLSIQTEAAQRHTREWQAYRQKPISQELANNAAGVKTDDQVLDPRFYVPLRQRREERTLASGADVDQAFGSELDNLRAKYDAVFAAGLEYKKTLAAIRADAKLTADGEELVAAAVAKTKAAFAETIRDLTGVTAANEKAAAEEKRFAEAVQSVRDEIDPTLPLIRAYEKAKSNIATLQARGDLNPGEATTALRNITADFDKKYNAASGNDAAQKIRDEIDPTLPVMRAYTEELNHIIDLQNRYKISASEAGIAAASLKTKYDALLKTASGADRAELFRDKQDPTRPIERARTATLADIDKAAAAPGGLTGPEKAAAIKAANEEYDKQIKAVNGVAKSEADAATAASAYRKQITALVDEIEPLAKAQREYKEELDFINHAAAKGDISPAQRDAGLILAKKNLDNNIEALRKHEKATQASTAASRQMQFALTNLSFQANDVVSSLGAGISPAQTFFQQFGQIVQIGQQVGFRNLSTSLWGLVTPLRAAVTGGLALGAAFTALVVRASNNAEQLRQFNLILEGTGKSSLTTAANLQKTVRELRDLGVGKDDANAAVSAIVRNPNLNPAQQDRIAKTGLDVATRLGTKDVDGIKTWTDAIGGGVDSLIKLGFQMEALSVPEANSARALQRHGDALKATNQLIDVITKNIEGAHKKSLTDATGAVNSLEAAWRKFFDALTDTGPLVEFNNLLKRSLEGWSEVFSGKSALFDGALGRSIMGVNTWVRGKVGLDNTSAAPAATVAPGAPTLKPGELGGTAAIPPATAATAAAASTSKAFTVTGNAPLVNVDPDLVDTFEKTLIETGMKAIITSSTGGGHAFGSQHYTRNTITGKGEALDYNLLDSAGNPILHKDAHTPGTAAYDAYVKFGETFKRLAPGKGRSGMDFSQVDPGHVDFGLLSGAPAGAAASSNVAVRSPEATEAAKNSYDKLNQSVEDSIRNGKLWGVVQQANIGWTQEYRQAIAEQVPEDEARARANLKYKEALALGTSELQKSIEIDQMKTAGLLKEAAGYGVSSAAGYRAAAAAEAEIEVKQRGIGSVAETTERKLREGAASAIQSSAQQAAAALPQLAALDKLAAATLKGTAAAHDQEIQNEAVLRTQDALQKAEAAGVPSLIALAKAEQDVALAQATRADKARQSIAAAEVANENRLTLARTQTEIQLTPTGATSQEIQRQVDYLTIAQNLATKYANASDDARKAYADTAIAIADANVALEKAQREQQRWNDLVGDLANKIDSELTKSIEDAFSGDKVESWGKRIQKWLGTASSTISSSLFIKPALGTVAGALGFGTVAQSLGSFSGVSNLLGTGGSSTTAGGGSSATITKNEDGTLNLSNISATASLGKSLGLLDTGSPGGGFLSNTSLGGLFNTSFADEAAGDFGGSAGLLDTTLGGFLGGAGAGFGAGSLLNSLLGGNKVTGTVGSGIGSLAGAAIGSIIPGVGTLIGGLVGGAAGGGLGGLFGQTHKSSNATGVSIDLTSGKATGFSSSGSAENDRTLKGIRDDLAKFTKNVQTTAGGTVSGYINPQATDQGIKLDYDIPGFGAGTYDTKDSQEAVDNAELAIVKGLTGVSDLTQMVIDKYSGNIDDLKTALDAASTYKDTEVTDTISTVIDKTSDPSKLADSLKFAETYDKIDEAAKDAFASIPSDLNIAGPFEKTRDDIKTTFDDITDSANEFGLSLEPVTAAFDEANKRLKEDFNRNINDLVEAATDPLQSLVDIEKRAGDARVKEAEAVAGDVEAVNKLNAKNLDKIWTDSTKSIQDLRDEFKTGDLSGLTDYQRLPAARTKYVDTLAAVQGGDTSKWDSLITDAKDLFTLSKGAYGEGPKTGQWRTAITAVLDNVLAGRSFAAGTSSTPPGMILVGERGPELISQPGGMHIYNHRDTERILASVVVSSASVAAMPKIPSFADGTTGQWRESLLSPPSFAALFDGSVGSTSNDNYKEIANLLRDVVSAVNVNNTISRMGHHETGKELRTQTSEMRKPVPYEPTRRRVAS